MVFANKLGGAAAQLTYGMVGGGQGAFIGDVHRKAAAFDGISVLAAGCFSRDYNNTLATGEALGVDRERCYRNFEEMAEREAARADGIDYAVIVTPNDSHYAAAKAFLNHGIHVVCDKPLTIEPEDARELAALAEAKGLLFCVTYPYSGYPLVKHARQLIRSGELGEIRMVMAEYPQEWLAGAAGGDSAQAGWRLDPARQGKSTSVGDIGCHIEHTVAYMTGLKIKSLCAKLDVYGPSALDTNASIMLRYDNGASGLYWASQIAIGHDNGLRIRIYGSKGSLEWEQENPNYMTVSFLGEPKRILSRGRDTLSPEASRYVRIPGGHPEGTYESFANLYLAFANALLKLKSGAALTDEDRESFPNAADGVSGVEFIDKCVQSAQRGSVWVDVDTTIGVEEGAS